MAIRGRSFWESKIGIVCGVVVCLLGLPILLPLAMIGHLRSQLRLRKLVESFLCLSCGSRLGRESIRIADERCAAEAREWHSKFPSVRRRTVRRLHAVCPHCGCEYTYREKEADLVRYAAAE